MVVFYEKSFLYRIGVIVSPYISTESHQMTPEVLLIY